MSDSSPTLTLLIADDHAVVLRQSLDVALGKVGSFEIAIAETPAECLDALRSGSFDVVLLDISFSPGSKEGIELVSEIRRLAPAADLLMLTSFDDSDSINQCMAAGAHDYISKNSLDDMKELLPRFDAALGRRKRRGEIAELGLECARRAGAVFKSEVMREVYAQVAQLRTEPRMHVLVTGPTGAGKELVARAISRQDEGAPFVAVNSSCFGRDMMESELFGHERGAFTGADRQKIGLIEEASGGDIFFDEIATLGLDHQAKLLRVLQSGEFFRVGGNKVLKTTARVIAATNEDLEVMVRRGKFREDLLQRLQRYHLRLPSLAERKEDIPAIVADVIAKSRKPQVEVSDECLKVLASREWPRNVRELEDCVTAAIMACDGKWLTVGDIPRKYFERQAVAPEHSGAEDHLGVTHRTALGTSYNDAVRHFSAAYIRAMSRHVKRPVTIEKLARALGMPKSTLGKRVLEFGIDLSHEQGER